MNRQVQCTEQLESPSNITKYCACHGKWLSWLILVLLRTTKYYKVLHSTTPYYKVLHSTTPYYKVLHSTTPYYKVQHSTTPYYSVLQSTTPVLLCTTKYYTVLLRTTKYYTVLLCTTQYYSVLQSTTRYYSVLQSTTQYYSVLQSTTPYYKVLHSTIRYYSVLQSPAQYYSVLLSWLILVTYETFYTMRGATLVTIQYHQILRLPRKMTLMTHESNRVYPPTSANAAPATENDSDDWSLSHMKRYLQCAEQQRLRSNINKYCACHENAPKFPRNSSKTAETSFAMRPIREWSDTVPRMIRPQNRQSATRLATEVTFSRSPGAFLVVKNTTFRAPAIIPNFTKCCTCHEKWHLNFTKYCACHEKWLSWLILVTYETVIYTMRRATEVAFQHHQILRLPRKMTLMIDPTHTWNVVYNAQSNTCDPQTSPNIAPATQNDSHDWSSSHMKRYLQCPDITKYCACHAKWLPKISHKFLPNRWNVRNNARPIREWSDHDLSMKPSVRNPPRNRCYLSRSPAPATKSDTWTSPNTAPATKSHCHDWSSSHMKRYLRCAEQQRLPSNSTKYCACHEK